MKKVFTTLLVMLTLTCFAAPATAEDIDAWEEPILEYAYASEEDLPIQISKYQEIVMIEYDYEANQLIYSVRVTNPLKAKQLKNDEISHQTWLDTQTITEFDEELLENYPIEIHFVYYDTDYNFIFSGYFGDADESDDNI